LSEELEKNAPLVEDVSFLYLELHLSEILTFLPKITLFFIRQVEEMSHQLRALSNKAPNDQQDVELIRRADQLRHRFSATRVLVEERKRRLQMADSRGRQTFDALG
jgi:hypothetical protein